jgi:hypothetical protein
MIKNAIPYNTKPSTEYFSKTIINRPPQENHGISINSNYQNMLPSKQTEPAEVVLLSDRSLIGEDKKSRKQTAPPTNKFDDF